MAQSCPKCGSERWMTDLLPIDFEHGLCVKQAGILSFAQGTSKLGAEACADCGFTEFYAKDPRELWTHWQERQPKRK